MQPGQAARRFHSLINANVDRLDRGEITLDAFRKQNRSLWDEIRMNRLDDEVLTLVRRDLPGLPAANEEPTPADALDEQPWENFGDPRD